MSAEQILTSTLKVISALPHLFDGDAEHADRVSATLREAITQAGVKVQRTYPPLVFCVCIIASVIWC